MGIRIMGLLSHWSFCFSRNFRVLPASHLWNGGGNETNNLKTSNCDVRTERVSRLLSLETL